MRMKLQKKCGAHARYSVMFHHNIIIVYYNHKIKRLFVMK